MRRASKEIGLGFGAKLRRQADTAHQVLKPRIAAQVVERWIKPHRRGKLDPDLLIYNLQLLESRISLSLLPNRAAATVSTILGLLALGLGAIGTYGILSFLVQHRRREMGIRIALGAPPARVAQLIIGQGMKWTATGLVFGLVAAFAGTLVLRRLLYGVSPANPIPFVGVAFLLAGIAYAACYVPARRASRVDPLEA